jgi:Fe-S-cluster-containing dehydrogenase component/CRP-like cAMP-binding protein
MDFAVEVQRPDRWDHPLDPAMPDEVVKQLLQMAPFANMDSRHFPQTATLAEILKNDSRLLLLSEGDVIFREGQYGASAYLVLDGQVRVFLARLASEGERQRRGQRSLLQCLSFGKWKPKGDRRKQPRLNLRKSNSRPVQFSQRGEGKHARIFLQDVPRVIEENASSAVTAGELFGEMAAVTRSPREFTAIAEVASQVLEIRWQGLKLLKQDPQFRLLLDERYRREVLSTHLRETPMLRYLPEEHLAKLVEAAKFESFGNLEWYAEYRKRSQQTAAIQISREPLIAEEGSYAVGLWIIRGGFARLSRRQGAGHRTLAYLGKGQMYGLRELVHNRYMKLTSTPLPYQESLRAIGYVDAVCIPKQAVQEHVLPFIRKADLPPPIHSPRYQFGQPVLDAELIGKDEGGIETGLLEFMVDNRLMNGREAMVIDTERCTRCDDCVRACAATHGDQPLFVRDGVQYGPWLFAQACMHCEDPVCMIGCPTGAIHRDQDVGTININAQTCIGCKSCAESCPYDNIRMVVTKDEMGRQRIDQSNGMPILQASKCDLCSKAKSGPACQSACPHDALVRINLGDLSKVNQWMQRRAA